MNPLEETLSMNKLEEARSIIQNVDQQMIELFLKRMQAAKMVAEYKMENQLPVEDKLREQELLKRNLSAVPLKLQKYYILFFESILKASKAYQEDLMG